eukprot:1181361-Pyramimonas_sp.AAC.1
MISPLLRASVQAHRANAVSTGTKDIREMSRSPVQVSRSHPAETSDDVLLCQGGSGTKRIARSANA